MTIVPTATTRPTFLEWVHKAFRRRMNADLVAEEYLVLLLEEYLRQDESASVLSEPLLVELQKSLSKVGNARFARIRKIGDASLFTAGVLGPHLGRSLMGIEHYVDVGQLAYRILCSSSGGERRFSTVYRRFASNLGPFVATLNEVSAEHIFSADLQDILFVFNRYMATKNPEDRRWLLEHGVVLLESSDQKKLIV